MKPQVRTLTLAEAAEARRRSGKPWLEFLRVPALSMGLYVLAAGERDPQSPHSEDEVYYVARGRGRFGAGDLDQEAAPGSIFFVPAGAEHRFHSITEEITVLVFFAPAEGSLGSD